VTKKGSDVGTLHLGKFCSIWTSGFYFPKTSYSPSIAPECPILTLHPILCSFLVYLSCKNIS